MSDKIQIKTDEEGGFTYYDMYKQAYFNMNKMDILEYESSKHKMKEWMIRAHSNYYMLLCRERNDYTIFQNHRDEHIGNTPIEEMTVSEVLEVAAERGEIVDIIESDIFDGFEIWVKNKEEAFMFLCFDATSFIVEVY